MVNKQPIIGQEAVCPDGLGRVVEVHRGFPYDWIKVQTYVNDRSCKWDFRNVQLVELRFVALQR